MSTVSAKLKVNPPLAVLYLSRVPYEVILDKNTKLQKVQAAEGGNVTNRRSELVFINLIFAVSNLAMSDIYIVYNVSFVPCMHLYILLEHY